MNLLFTTSTLEAQQFYSDNQWVAPHGVATLVGTVGEEYSQAYLVAALIPEWEFNAQVTHYYDDPDGSSESFTATNLFVKHRMYENEAGTSGYGFLAGTGLFPEHLAQGETTTAFQSWWATAVFTKAFADDRVFLDVMPGAMVNLDHGDSGDTAWGFTYASRMAVYGVIPQSAIVGEVFGTTGEAYAKPNYRVGIRWESPKLVIAASYSDAFDGSGGAGFELGLMYFTDARFCFGGCSRNR